MRISRNSRASVIFAELGKSDSDRSRSSVARLLRSTLVGGGVLLISAGALGQVQPPTTTASSWISLNSSIEITRGGGSLSIDQANKLVTLDPEGDPNKTFSAAAFAAYESNEALIKLSTNTLRRQLSVDDPKFLITLEAKLAWALRPGPSPSGMTASADLNGYVAQLRFSNPNLQTRRIKYALYLDRKGDSVGAGVVFTLQSKCGNDKDYVEIFHLNAPNANQDYQRAQVLEIPQNTLCYVRIVRSGQFSNGLAVSDGEVRIRFGFKG